jgi:L,D-peptidoglycan transpeptidase YkuD (ErfK/YbiS/YcfS/YnhG family)
MGWCNDSKSKLYNKLINTNLKVSHEKMFREDSKYDLVVSINYNTRNIIQNKGSAIFIHLTKNYKKTQGCVVLNKKDLLILLKLINKKTRIKIL